MTRRVPKNSLNLNRPQGRLSQIWAASALAPRPDAATFAGVTSAQGARAKITRAFELLLEFDDELHNYMNADPIGLRRQTQPDGDTVVIVLQVTELAPLNLSLLIREITHQMRSALDHLAYALVLAAGNTPTRRTAFPFLTARPAGGLRIEGGVSSAAMAVIDEFQPYQRTDATAHPLHPHGTMEHRQASAPAPHCVIRHRNAGLYRHARRIGNGPRPFQTTAVGDDCVLGVLRFEGGDFHPDLEVTTSGSSFNALGVRGRWRHDQSVQLLEGLHQYLAQVVLPRLEEQLETSQ